MQEFDHEKLDVFCVSIEFVSITELIVSTIPKGKAYLSDQLRRAGTSIVLNIAEGAGEFCGTEKARFYRMAKRSATECAAVLTVCQCLGLCSTKDILNGRHLLLRIVSMLTKMVKLVGEQEKSRTHTLTRTGTTRVSGTGSD